MNDDMNDLMKEATSLQRGMMFALLKSMWPFILGGLVLSAAFVAFMVWLIVQIAR